MKALFLGFLCCCFFWGQAQSDSSALFSKSVLSVHPFFVTAGYEALGNNRQFTFWRLGMEARYSWDVWDNRYRFGPTAKVLFELNTLTGNEAYYFMGLYHQYNFLYKRHNRLYVEMSAYYSNFCLCNPSNFTQFPENRPGSYYLSLAAGWNIFLHPHWDLKFAYQFHWLLNPPPTYRNWGQLTIGIDYYFYDRVRRVKLVERRARRRAKRQTPISIH